MNSFFYNEALHPKVAFFRLKYICLNKHIYAKVGLWKRS